MIHDAKVEVTCDGKGCQNSIEVSPPFVYENQWGGGGRYDCDDDTIGELAEKEGWNVKDDQQFCESCEPSDEDED